MLHKFKRRLYFVVATYFAFWAKLVLMRWHPRVIVITGSSGKTTLLHLVEAQLGDKAIFSHHANSSFGIPFHILGLPPNVSSKAKWLVYALTAPFHIFRRLPAKKIYVVEADTDRPHEGAFLSRFLRPEVTLWISVFRTHSQSFDPLVQAGQFKSTEAAIAYDFGNYAINATKLVLANGDQTDLVAELKRVPAGVDIQKFSIKNVSGYRLTEADTVFEIDEKAIRLPGLHPKQLGISLQMVSGLLEYLGMPGQSYEKLVQPPGRSSVFKGQRHTLLIDSTYNTGLGATGAVLELFEAYPRQPKWVVIGDILEQGSVEQDEHEKLADLIASHKPDQVILEGPRTQKYSLPRLKKVAPKIPVESFDGAKDVLDYLSANLKGDEVVLFKGARGLEGVVEALLADPADAKRLVRREARWVKRRQAWGLPR